MDVTRKILMAVARADLAACQARAWLRGAAFALAAWGLAKAVRRL